MIAGVWVHAMLELPDSQHFQKLSKSVRLSDHTVGTATLMYMHRVKNGVMNTEKSLPEE
jgi:hypothetical protein